MPPLDIVPRKGVQGTAQYEPVQGSQLGPKQSLRKILYALVAERIILYAAPIWYKGKLVLANRLQNIQRDIFLCVTKCFKTVSTYALNVFDWVLPLDQRAEMDQDFTFLVRWKKSVEGIRLDPESVDLWKPTRKQYCL